MGKRKLKIKKPATKKKQEPRTTLPSDINQITQRIKRYYLEFKDSMELINHAQRTAFDRMFELGDLLMQHEEPIKDHYGTWKAFGEKIGINPSVLSRCRASVADFRMHDAYTLEDARNLLESRGFEPSAKLMEQNINRILTDSDNAGKKKTVREKEDKRDLHLKEFHQMQSRAEEIMAQHDPDDELYHEAKHTVDFIKDSIEYFKSLDISQKKWNCEAYLQFCRDIKFDVIKGEPVDATDPMHIAPDGSSGSQGGKVADFFAIPGSRDTHEKLDNDELDVSRADIAEYHRWTMAMFLFNYIQSDK